MNTAIATTKRTPEQNWAYFEAMHIADDICRREDRQMSEDEFSRLYRATLHRHMLEALEPITKAKARYMAMYPHSAIVVAPDGFWKFMQQQPTDAITLLSEMEQRIAERYTRGLT